MRPLARVLFDESHRQAWTIRPPVAAHMNPGEPADASYAQAAATLTTAGFQVTARTDDLLDGAALSQADVLVLPHCSIDDFEATTGAGSPVYAEEEIAAIEAFVRAGGGLVILAETEQAKYGNNLGDIAARFGISIRNATVHDPVARHHDVSTWVLAQPCRQPDVDVLAGVDGMCFYRTGALKPTAPLGHREGEDPVTVVARTHATATPPEVPLLVAVKAGDGRVVVSADSDLFGDDNLDDYGHRRLWRNLVTWSAAGPSTLQAAGDNASSGAGRTSSAVGQSSSPVGQSSSPVGPSSSPVGQSSPEAGQSGTGVAATAGRAGTASQQAQGKASAATQHPAWQRLRKAVENLRPLQAKDGSIAAEYAERAAALVAEIEASIEDLAPLFPHQAEHLSATVRDFRRWSAEGLGVPDFLDSLMLFQPQRDRTDGQEHLVVFPMYTQNGNPNRNVEAVVVRTVWPDWIARLEASGYDNAAFVPIEFVGWTAGYDTHSAVLFPETVATRERVQFSWGGIFCDREAARFRVVTAAAARLLRFSPPPDLEMLLNDQSLAQQTYVLWDLVHDRTHSHGELPFDPFMIKQRMPYWMYGLEELRCDLSTYRETAKLEADGVPLARHVRLAILADRLFRFPTTGERVRNYDGLAGQILFAWLHKHGALEWRDNRLSIDWFRVDDAVVSLCDAVEALYNEGIDRSRLGHWLAAHEFVSGLVPPSPASVWAQGPSASSASGRLPAEPKEAVNAVLPDEFPLNVFYEALRKKLAPTIESTRGITGAPA